MPPLPVIANTYRCALKWVESGTGQIAVNVIHIRAAATDPMTVGDAIVDAWDNRMYEVTASTATMALIDITLLDGSSATLPYTVAAPKSGGTGGQFAPQVSAVISLGTAIRGRSFRGRVYTPFAAETAIANGSMGGTEPADLRAGWEAFMSGLNGESPTMSLVVASYKEAVATDVTTVTVLNALGTQRRRQTRVRYP